MKIAVTYENGNVFQHFGHTEQFKLYETEDGKVIRSEIVSTEGQGHGALSGFLARNGVKTVICGGIGGGAQIALSNAGIALYAGITGNTDKAVESLLAGTLPHNASANCSHHEHGHSEAGHKCGDHGCGGDCHDHK